jgi:hypothetical protein
VGYLRFSEEDKEKVNRSRKEIMLEPSEEALRKMAFQLEHPYFILEAQARKRYLDGLIMRTTCI